MNLTHSGRNKNNQKLSSTNYLALIGNDSDNSDLLQEIQFLLLHIMYSIEEIF